MICAKVKVTFDEWKVDPTIQDFFVASSGWIQKFMKRHGLSLGKYPFWCSFTWQVIAFGIPTAFFMKIYDCSHLLDVCFFFYKKERVSKHDPLPHQKYAWHQ